jgi:hypothetical protein
MDFQIHVHETPNPKFPNLELSPLLEIAKTFDLSPPKWSELDYSTERIPFESSIIDRLRHSKKTKSITLHPQEIGEYEFNLTHNIYGNSVSLYALNNFYSAQHDEGLKKLIKIMRQSIGSPAVGSINLFSYYREDFRLTLPSPPNPFGAIDWLLFSSLEAYEPFFSREDLLNAPAHEVLEWDDGTIQIMTYKDFLPYDRPEALEAIRKLSLYLNEKRLDGARIIPELV